MKRYKAHPLTLNQTLELTEAIAKEYRTIVLVEGLSDMLAINTLARRLDIDFTARRIAVISMGGATNIGHFMTLLKPYQHRISIAGLYDIGEEYHFEQALEGDLEAQGFYVCNADLEDELINAVGVDTVLDVAARQRELNAFRKLQRQPQWQGREIKSQLRRWMGSGGTRKIRYAELLVNALNLSHIPAPLDQLITHISNEA